MKKDLNGMHDQELDDLFKRSLENSYIPYREEDWKKMAALLDLGKPVSVPANNKLLNLKNLLSGLILLFVAGSTVLVLSDPFSHFSHDTPDYLLTRVDVEKISAAIPEELPYGLLSRMPDSKKQQGKMGSNQNNNPSVQGQNYLPSRDSEFYVPMKNEREARERRITSDNNPIIIKDSGSMPFEFKSGIMPAQDLSVSVHEKLSGLKTRDPFSIPHSYPSHGLYSKFSLAILLSPDINAGKNSRASGLGKSAGLNLEYFIHKNISLNLGALYSLKEYNSREYAQRGASYTYQLNGDCWILDIPMNVRYYPINHLNTRLYLSTGISSYLMLREQYQIDYGQNSPLEGYSYSIQGRNQHYFGVLNFGAGMERNLPGSWSLQLEPYFKLPVNGIGEHAINLNSAGLWVGLKYRW